MSTVTTQLSRALSLALFAMVGTAPAWAQEKPEGQENTPTEAARPGEATPASTPPSLSGAGKVDINYVDADLMGLVEYFARATGRNFILGDVRELQGKKITIISNRPVTPAAAYEAFLSALEIHGLTTVKVGSTYKIVKAQDAQQSPGPIREGGDIAATDNYVTQIMPLENVSVSDIRTIIDNLVSPNAKVLAYAPSNTLILTDSGNNLRRIYKLIMELDVAAPKSRLEIYPIEFADAGEIKTLIEELYGSAETETTTSDSRSSRRSSRSSRRRSDDSKSAGEGVTAGKESKYISKVISDERTNTLVVLANEEGHSAVTDLIGKLDIDVDPNRRSQIYVVRLENAKAEEVASVLSELSQSGSSSNQQNQRRSNQNAGTQRVQRNNRNGDSGGSSAETRGAVAAFDSGMRIAADEATNSLVIIASRDDYAIVSSVIKQLDLERKQVMVDAVVMELASNDSDTFDIAAHLPIAVGDAVGIVGAQLGTNSLGIDPAAALAGGLTSGIFGQSVEVPVLDPTTGQPGTLSIPSFGIAIQALQSTSLSNIISSPNITVMDNETGKIEVGRKIPFPVSGGFNSVGNQLTTFQREDVAITLEVTPRINSENSVTMEVLVDVEEVEPNQPQGLDPNQAGFITSKRSAETVALVGDNQTVVIGGLMAMNTGVTETKVPILGDLPLIGALFRSSNETARRSNLLIFLTPHIIDSAEDKQEIMRVKEAQRQEFMRRFYGRSQDEAYEEIMRLLQYSMNDVSSPSVYRGPTSVASTVTLDGAPLSEASRVELKDLQLIPAISTKPGELPKDEMSLDVMEATLEEDAIEEDSTDSGDDTAEDSGTPEGEEASEDAGSEDSPAESEE